MSDTAHWIIEQFDSKKHEVQLFDCGEQLLDDWIKTKASQFHKRDIARTYVLMTEKNNQVLGYYSLTNHSVNYAVLPEEQLKGLPRIDIPVVLLGKLAIDLTIQGQGMGQFLLMDALRRTLFLADKIGIRALEVDALNPKAKAFYLSYGFLEFKDDPFHLFLPVSVIRKLNLPPL